YDDADPAEALDDLAVHILTDRPLGDAKALDAAQGHVLADGGDGVGDRLGDRAPAHVMGAEHRLDADVRRLVERHRHNPAHQRLEVVVAGDEIGLGIDLDDDADIILDSDPDEALGGNPPALLGRLGEALLAQPVDGRLDVAVRLAQRVLAIHHARAGLLAQILDQPRGDRSHRFPSLARLILRRCVWTRAGPDRLAAGPTRCANPETSERFTLRPSARGPARPTCRGRCGR